jgi:hypothetical protein
MIRTKILLALALCGSLVCHAAESITNVNLGTGPNSGNGDPIRTAFTKLNNNFSNLLKGNTYTGVLFSADARLIQQTPAAVGYAGTSFILGGQGNTLISNGLSGIIGGYGCKIEPDDPAFVVNSGILFGSLCTNSSGGSVIMGGHDNTITNSANSIILGAGNNYMDHGDDSLMFTSGSYMFGAAILFGGGIVCTGVCHIWGNVNVVTNKGVGSSVFGPITYLFGERSIIFGDGFFVGRGTAAGSSSTHVTNAYSFGSTNKVTVNSTMAIGFNMTNGTTRTVKIGADNQGALFNANGEIVLFNSDNAAGLFLSDLSSGVPTGTAIVISNSFGQQYSVDSFGNTITAGGLNAAASIKGPDVTGTNGLTVGTVNQTILAGTANPTTSAYPNGSIYLQTNGPVWLRQNGAWCPIGGSMFESTLTESSATAVVTISLASGKSCGVRVFATTRADDATNFQEVSDSFNVAAINKAGTVTPAISAVATANAVSSGTLSTAWTVVANGNGLDIKNNAVSSLTQTTLKTKWRIEVDSNDGAYTITPH